MISRKRASQSDNGNEGLQKKNSMVRLPAASCHDAGVATCEVLTVVDKKEETEEDSLSTTSTIDLYYSEEADDEDNDVDYEEEEEVDSEPTEEDKQVEDYIKAKNSKILSDLESRMAKWPDKDEWVASWKQESSNRQQRWTLISVYAYFDKKPSYGGYGVVLRNSLGNPITALAKFSKHGKSFYHQVFMGIKVGVELAEKRGLSDLRVQCNTLMVPVIFQHACCCTDKECMRTCDVSKICQSCDALFRYYKGCDLSLAPLVLELRCKKRFRLSSALFETEAAHYLAKREKIRNRRPEVEKKEEEGTAAPPDEIELDDFPQALKNILWKEAFGRFSK